MKIIGHEKIQESLQKSILTNQIHHAYLFAGPANLGKETLALEFIRKLNISSNDLYILNKASAIKIKEIRDLQRKLSLTAQSKHKIALIKDAALITHEAANALLKTLEEPKNTILILISQNKEQIIPTITSRCLIHNFNLVPQKELSHFINQYELTPSENKQILNLSQGRPGIALRLIKNKKAIFDRQKFLYNFSRLLNSNINTQFQFVEKIIKQPQNINKIINLWLSWLRDLLLIKSSNQDFIVNQANLSELNIFSSKYKTNKIIELIDYLKGISQTKSINEKLALENFFLKI